MWSVLEETEEVILFFGEFLRRFMVSRIYGCMCN
jgi:hypothetical protein